MVQALEESLCPVLRRWRRMPFLLVQFARGESRLSTLPRSYPGAKILPKKVQLAITAALEHYTATLAEMLLACDRFAPTPS